MKKILNFLGNILGYLFNYGTCTNCNCSFLYRERDSLIYTKSPIQLEKGSMMKGVAVCGECMSAFNRLEKEKITSKLKKSAWKDEEIELVCEAVDAHNKSFIR